MSGIDTTAAATFFLYRNARGRVVVEYVERQRYQVFQVVFMRIANRKKGQIPLRSAPAGAAFDWEPWAAEDRFVP